MGTPFKASYSTICTRVSCAYNVRMALRFEWDERKNSANRKKHKVTPRPGRLPLLSSKG